MTQSGFLEVRHGAEVRQVPVLPSVMGIGRAQDNQVVLDDPSISRHHARLQWTGAWLQIIDLGSNNGTMVNGLRIQPNYPVTLKEGDNISVGGFSMIARLPTAAGGETVVSGPTVAPGVPTYTPMPYPTQPPPQVMPPMQPQMPQVIRVEVPREAPLPAPPARQRCRDTCRTGRHPKSPTGAGRRQWIRPSPRAHREERIPD